MSPRKTKQQRDAENMLGVGVAPPAGTPKGPNEDKPNRKAFDLGKYLGMAGEVAQSTVYWGNAKFKNAEKHFPQAPHMRTAAKFFPYYQEAGKQVGLYVDEPNGDDEMKDCLKKAAAMQAEGLRYVYIDRMNMSLEDVREQLAPKKASA